MYRCPECGTEYTVVPDACTVCGHETDTSEHIDLFAKAAEQERRITAQQKEMQQQYQDRAQEHVQAHDAAKSRSAIAAEERLTVLEQAIASAPGGAEQATAAAEWDAAKQGKSHTGLKLAAVGAAAAVALGGGAFWTFRGGKSAGFVRNAVGTFYMKNQDLWFQNGQTGKKICLKESFFPLPSTRVLFTEYGNMERLNEMLYVSPDGNDFYFPAVATIGVENCVLMHCTADHPELAEEVAQINLRAGDYNSNIIYTGSYSSYYMSGYSANSYLSGETDLYQMNLPYVVCDGAVYYRNANSEFCCTQNGETQAIAPFVERFWTMPDQPGVYYIGVPGYEELREKREWMGEYIHTDYECMNGFLEVVLADGGETLETRMHGDDYVLCRITPGNPAVQLVSERIEDWKPIRGDFTQYFYYTTYNREEQVTQLRRYDFLSGTAETVYSTDAAQRVILLQDYPDGSCYLGTYKAPTAEDMADWLPDQESLKLMYEDDSPNRYAFYVPMQDLNIYYQESGGEQLALPVITSDNYRSVYSYSGELYTNAQKPYIGMADYNNFRKTRVFYRDQEVTVTFNPETKVYTSPDSLYVSPDGTRLIAYSVDYSTSDSNYSAPKFKICCGTLNGAEEVVMDIVADYDDDGSVLTLELENEPAEVLHLSYGNLYSGDEKIASGVLNTGGKWQPEYRQICFLTNEDYNPSPDEMYIDMSTDYCGTLMRRSDRKTETVAESVTDFIPFDKEQFMVICGEKGENGDLHYCAGEKQYQVDTDVTNLIGLKPLAEKSLLDRILN